MSDQLLNDSANSELRSMLGFSESESIALMQVTTMKLATKTTKVASMTAKTVEEIVTTGPMIMMQLNNVRRRIWEVSFTAVEAYHSSSAEGIGPSWNTLECTPYYEPIE